MSHVMGRGILYGTLGDGGTAYFAAKSDLSTLLEDLALVRPTEARPSCRASGTCCSRSSRARSTAGLADGADREAVEAEVMAEQRAEPPRRTVRLGDDGLRADLRRD